MRKKGLNKEIRKTEIKKVKERDKERKIDK